jgi:hypothetical protein
MVRIPPAPPRVNIDDMSDSSINSLNQETPSKNRKQRRPANLHIHNSSNSLRLGTAENDTLTPEHNQAPADPVAVVTPRASAFEESGQSSPDIAGGAAGLTSGATIKRSRKVASRSNSGSGTIRRIRKASTGSRSPRRTVPVRDSDIEHGDDEGYEDLINSYDSEDMDNVAGPRWYLHTICLLYVMLNLHFMTYVYFLSHIALKSNPMNSGHVKRGLANATMTVSVHCMRTT